MYWLFPSQEHLFTLFLPAMFVFVLVFQPGTFVYPFFASNVCFCTGFPARNICLPFFCQQCLFLYWFSSQEHLFTLFLPAMFVFVLVFQLGTFVYLFFASNVCFCTGFPARNICLPFLPAMFVFVLVFQLGTFVYPFLPAMFVFVLVFQPGTFVYPFLPAMLVFVLVFQPQHLFTLFCKINVYFSSPFASH